MSFNGSGVFQRLYSWVNDAAANIKIRADRMDNEMDGFAVGLSTCITKDGQTTITANLPMAGFRHTGVGNAANRTDYASFGQVQDGKAAWVAAGGTSDAITAAYTIPITTLTDGQQCFVRAASANTTTTPTFSPNGLTARTIVKNNGAALAVGDIAGAGHELQLRYDLANTRWVLMNPRQAATVPFNPASASGPASIDLAEDTDNGTNTVTLQAPASLAANATVTLPNTSGTLALISDAQAQALNPGGRLTLTTGVPVTTSDVTAASTLYYTPYVSNQIALYNGTAWSLYTFTERSLALSGLTSGRPYDVFLYDNAGTLTLELTAWTNDTTRATALVYQDGVLVRSGATTRRYLGTIYTTGTTTTEDSRANRYVWNYYNRQHREMLRTDATVSWNYSTTTWRQANGSTANQLNFVVGVSESIVTCQLVGTVRNSTATARGVFAQIALDNTTGSSFAGLGGGFSVVAIDVNFTIVANTLVAAGRHYLAWLEYGAGTDTQTWSGGNARGLTGTIWA